MQPRYHGRRAIVLGLGMTGLSLARHLARHGAHVRVADTRLDPPNREALAKLLPGVALETGDFSDATFGGAETIAISPGVSQHHPAIRSAIAAGAEIVGDIELFARALPADQKVLAVTGTNGKSTVTSLTGALTQAAGLSTIVAGNIGHPVLDALAVIEAGAAWPNVFVLELSSYQLETTSSLRPVAATVLNVSANHMDRYAGIADYAAAKARIFTNANVQVINRDDPIVRLMRLPGRTVQTFGASVPLSEEEWGLVERADGTWLARGGELIMQASRLALVGRHNVQNALAALALASSVTKLGRAMQDALAAFRGLPHRMAPIAEADDVLYIDDSKGTTVAATQVALEGLDRPVVLIAGGDGKGQSFVPLRAAVDRRCRAVLLIGRDAPRIERALAGSHVRVERVGTLALAVERAIDLASPGDAVLLSPACASLDQFRDYVERGHRFADLVNARLAADVDA
ncbi:MAG TPA: UDP-N-acetylmuramoyl-L-alanine--D-glutamate ligase [Casimicrobiaceae bacterium]|nr:UDP-N-acetylmuramoyl-L-alanine--D-glutamate ligase [Casimicrobiaceae bacterium]